MTGDAAVVVRRRSSEEIAAAVARLRAAGLSAKAARAVATSPTWGPVVLGPGVIVSLFPLPEASEGRVAS